MSIQPQSPGRGSDQGAAEARYRALAHPRRSAVRPGVVIEVELELGGGLRADVAPRQHLAALQRAGGGIELHVDRVVGVALRNACWRQRTAAARHERAWRGGDRGVPAGARRDRPSAPTSSTAIVSVATRPKVHTAIAPPGECYTRRGRHAGSRLQAPQRAGLRADGRGLAGPSRACSPMCVGPEPAFRLSDAAAAARAPRARRVRSAAR